MAKVYLGGGRGTVELDTSDFIGVDVVSSITGGREQPEGAACVVGAEPGARVTVRVWPDVVQIVEVLA